MVDHFCPFTSNLVFVKLLKSLEVGYQLVLVIGNEPIFWAPTVLTRTQNTKYQIAITGKAIETLQFLVSGIVLKKRVRGRCWS